jgi:hypothetical protein
VGFFKSIISGPDNVTGDELKVGFFLALLAVIGFTGWDVLHEHVRFNITEFCIGFGALVGSTAAAVAGKQLAKAMPPADPPSQ